ncbi:MAG: LysR family transcriptional regulator [Asticcacaulis sp.]
MPRENFNDLIAFLAVAREGSFTKAAARMGVSQSALSHTIRALEERLGLRLLTRTTRKVSLTEAGERLFQTMDKRIDDIESELVGLTELRDKPAGTIRITTGEHAAETLLLPMLERLLPQYPDINVEITIDYGLTDIVAERFDAGIRMGEQVAQGMIAVPIGPDLRMAVFGAPAYLAKHGMPETPQDLLSHNCINLRLPTHGGLYAWELDKDGQELKVRVNGQLVFNNATQIVKAAERGLGLACLPLSFVQAQVDAGDIIHVLKDWCTPFAGYHLYYPSRRQNSSAFALLVDALRYRS